MSSALLEPPAECPTCGATAIAIVVTGPDAENIRYSCGCPISAAVYREHTRPSDVTDDDEDEGNESGEGRDDTDADSSEGQL